MPESAGLRVIVHDRESGARELTEKTLRWLQELAAQSKAADGTELLGEVQDATRRVLRSKPEMAILFNALDGVIGRLEAAVAAGPEVGNARLALLSILEGELRAQTERAKAAAEAAASLVENGDLLLTHSRSSTVLAGLAAARRAGKTFDVFVTESRPMLEGRRLARELAELQIPVRLVVDAAVDTIVPEASRALIGADSITAQGVVNKVGSRSIARACRDAGVPFVVAADTQKAWRRSSNPLAPTPGGRSSRPGEVWDRPPAGVEILNPIFELVPKAEIRQIASELGATDFDAYWANVSAPPFSRWFREVFNDELA